MSSVDTAPGVKIMPTLPNRKVDILPESGAVCRNPDGSDALKQIEASCRMVGEELRHEMGDMELLSPDGRLPYSREVTLKRVEKFVLRVIESVREKGASVIGLVGSHKISLYGTGVMLGLTPQDLWPASVRQSSVLLVASRNPLDGPQRHDLFTNAFDVSGSRTMDGRVGVLFGDEVYAAPGLWRPTDAPRLQSRYPVLARQNRTSNNWGFSKQEPEHQPIGKGDKFGLDHDVRVWTQQNGEDFPTVGEMQKSDPSGLVIKAATRKDPFEELNRKTLKHLNQYRVPTVIVNDSQDAPFQKPSPVAEQHANLIDGRRLLPEEAQLVLAHGLFQANESVIKDTHVNDIMLFLRRKFAEYPFR